MFVKIIYLSFRHLVSLGVNIGHDRKNYKFLSSWIFGGWRNNIFFINLLKTIYFFRIGIRAFVVAARRRRPVWFVSFNGNFGPLIARYGYTCGELFNIYWWINGSVTNFYRILGWNQLLVRLMMKDKYKLRHMDRKKIQGFFGLLNHRKRVPTLGFIPNVLESSGSVNEFMCANIPCVSIIDSNVNSIRVSIPVPGNDDSFICINYYCYLFSRALLSGKIINFRRWEDDIYDVETTYRSYHKFVYLYLNFYKNYNQDKLFKGLDYIDFNKLVEKWTKGEMILENGFLENLYASYLSKKNFLNMKVYPDGDDVLKYV